MARRAWIVAVSFALASAAPAIAQDDASPAPTTPAPAKPTTPAQTKPTTSAPTPAPTTPAPTSPAPTSPAPASPAPTSSAPTSSAPVAPAGRVPVELSRIEVADMTFGMRDDFYSTINVAADGTVWAGTFEGRVYNSRDGGVTWDEASVLPQRRSLYGFAGQEILFGSLRGDNTVRSPLTDLAQGLGEAADGASLGLLRGGRDAPGTEALALDGKSDYGARETHGALGGFAEAASGAAAQLLGIGLSSRAPRLSQLLAVRGRVVPNVSLGRLLVSSGSRPTEIRYINQHPLDPKLVFAATRFGLYRSRDGGVSWMPVYMGATAVERGTFWITFDPVDKLRMYLGTERGMFVSVDGGGSWVKNGALPDIQAKYIVVDPTDPNYIYVAGFGGLFRSSDRGRTFVLAYFSTQARLNDVVSIAIDPFDPSTAYIGTAEGTLVTNKLRESRVGDFRFVAPMRTLGLYAVMFACTKHKGHLFMLNRADLFTIYYGANGPESLVSESWDAGKTWRALYANVSQGDLRWMAVDPVDPDLLYVAASRALVKLVRRPPADAGTPREPVSLAFAGPPMTEVVQAALDHHHLGPGAYQRGLDKLRSRAWIPSALTIAGVAGRHRSGRIVDDEQFADDRYLASTDFSEWRVMAWASWRLPDLIYTHDAVALQKLRINTMNDEVRFRVVHTVYRHYGELQRLRARIRAGQPRDLYTRAVERARMDELEAIVDLTSGGYLSKQRKEKP